VAVHEEVRKFWEAHYSANVMRASLVSRHSLDELEGFARAAFSGIANKRLAAPHFTGKLPTSCMSAGPAPGNTSLCIRAAIQAGSFVCFPHLSRLQLPLASIGPSRHYLPSACMHCRRTQPRCHTAFLTDRRHLPQMTSCRPGSPACCSGWCRSATGTRWRCSGWCRRRPGSTARSRAGTCPTSSGEWPAFCSRGLEH
jgi:Peptidase M16 inactive domain